MKTLVWITFPTVDIVNPEEDEIIEHLARLLQKCGLKGEFIFSGVKVQITKANRPATIDFLNQSEMTIGYQGNAHSLHPGLMEYEEDRDWEDGIREATHRETGWIHMDGTTDPSVRGGILLLKDTFGKQFTGFRGAGGWTPQLMDVLRNHGIKVHHTLFDLAEASGYTMASYLGCLQVSPGRSKWTGQFPYASPMTNRLELEQIVRHSDEGIREFVELFERMVENYPFRGPRVLFVNFHPFFLFTDTIGDVINYGNGQMPEPPNNLVRSNLLPEGERDRRWNSVEQIFEWLSKRPDVQFITSADYVKSLQTLNARLDRPKVEQLAEEIVLLPLMRPPAYVRCNGTNYSLSECFSVMQSALKSFIKHSNLPEQIETRMLLGPSDLPAPETERVVISTVGEILNSISSLDENTIPTDIKLAGGTVAPYPFLIAMARAYFSRESPNRTIPIRPTDFQFPEFAESFNIYLRRCADWQIYRRHLNSAKMEKHASLQLWTYKPLDSLNLS